MASEHELQLNPNFIFFLPSSSKTCLSLRVITVIIPYTIIVLMFAECYVMPQDTVWKLSQPFQSISNFLKKTL